MRVRRARTSWVTSLTIFAFALGGMVVNHFASLTLPASLYCQIRTPRVDAEAEPALSRDEQDVVDHSQARQSCRLRHMVG